jgi:hypothetical protein
VVDKDGWALLKAALANQKPLQIKIVTEVTPVPKPPKSKDKSGQSSG